MQKNQQEVEPSIKLPYKLVPFMRYRKWGYTVSLLVVVLSLFFIFTKGFNWGLDFTGGTVVETTFSQPADLPKIRTVLVENGVQGAIVQSSGDSKNVIIRLPASLNNPNTGTFIKNILSKNIDPQIKINSLEFVGPSVGAELTQSAIYATLATLGMLLLYVGLRFEWRLALGAILSLAHDVIVTIGIFSFFQIEIDLTFVAAILSVIGYSLNDSIVVFDRVRENFCKIRRTETIEIIDISLSQTLSRTLMTSATTLIVVLALLLFGGASIHSFSLALLIGIGFGTYSSIYIAIALAVDFGLKREHMIPPKVVKEGAELEMP
ncbi:protein translocase subunit SecF [Mergibacter septicus]|uniref:Protein-export membrane protein SecF n=1 Tax=Mergibacter septicus TaxID=221402 RepID=A0A8E3MHH3_9PAST|nr:protein translocase subunit SecF [Mergibacter septicus]AWX16302.1 protein translocase subunit SecF [Mergibacter septicus]QDJ15552.1 protein translocase subunit SecF [Mergibacter septicus]UTU48866.1 protein translocase subunit SecF [Mergibacter septicus]WMR96830.1 protein translocase subunit SecF [Mergibacter septicus]